MRKPRIKIEDSPREVNDLLVEKWGISLFRFAQAFAVSPLDLVLQKPSYPVSLQEIRKAHSSLMKVWKAIEDDARHFSCFMDKLSRPTMPRVFSTEEFRKETGIEDFRLRYFLPRLWIILVLELNRGARQGIGLNKKSIIALSWCNQISNSGKRIDWKLLGDLYDWFWQKVEGYDYYREWDPGQGIEDYLKNQFHRYRWPGDTNKYLESIDSLTESETFGFFFKLFLLRWWKVKIKYPIDKLPITNKELPRFIRNFTINIFMGESEGLSLFSKQGSLADSSYFYLNSWLRQTVNGNCLPPYDDSVSRMIEAITKAWGLPYEGSEVGEYIQYAARLYLDHKADLKNLPPMIIFSDRSYFSTGI